LELKSRHILRLDKKVVFHFIALLSILFFFSLFYSVRFGRDDMVLSLVFRENSFLESFKWYYQHFSFRPAVLFLVFVTLGSDDPQIYTYTILAYFMLVYCFWTWTLYKIFGLLFPWLKEQKYFLLSFSLIQIAAIYFLCSDRIEVFGWATSSMLYLVPVVFSFYVAYLLIKPQLKRFEYAGLCVGAIMIAGSLEYLAAFDLILGLGVIFYYWHSRKNGAINGKEKIARAIFFTSILAVFSVLCMSNPGLLERMHGGNALANSGTDAGGPYQASFWSMFFKPHKLIGLGLVFISWAHVVNLKPDLRLRQRGLMSVLLCFVLGIALTLVSHKFSGHSIAIGRMWFLTDVMGYILSVALLLFLWPKIRLPLGSVYILTGIVCVIFSYYSVKHIMAQWTFVARYDKVITRVKNVDQEEVIVIGLPRPDLGSASALSNDPEDGANRLFCRFYKISGSVSDSTATDRK